MKAMHYEYLLRRVYQVGRYGRNGADADEYRELEQAEAEYKLDLENIKNGNTRISTKSIEKLKYEYEVQCGKIWRFVSTAIQKGIVDFGYQFSESEIEELKSCIIVPDPLTKEAIDKVINKAEKILAAHKIYPA